METIINTNEIDNSFIEEIKNLYFNKKVKITVEEVRSFDEMNGKERLERIKKLRKKHPPFYVPEGIDISDLANQVNI